MIAFQCSNVVIEFLHSIISQSCFERCGMLKGCVRQRYVRKQQGFVTSDNLLDVRFSHQPVSCTLSWTGFMRDSAALVFAGLFLNNAACRNMAAFRLSGVTGGARLRVTFDAFGTLGFGVATPLPSSSDGGIVECWLSSPSGSFSSSSRSAALCACSARALRASSTGAADPEGSPEGPFESALAVM